MKILIDGEAASGREMLGSGHVCVCVREWKFFHILQSLSKTLHFHFQFN